MPRAFLAVSPAGLLPSLLLCATCAVLGGGCPNADLEALDRSLAERRERTEEEQGRAALRLRELTGAGGVDPTTRRPIGYPADLPLIEGGEPVAGGFDPGVVRTCTLRYGIEADALVSQLVAAAVETGWSVADEEQSVSGTHRLRLERREHTVSVAVRAHAGGSAIQLVEPRAAR